MKSYIGLFFGKMESIQNLNNGILSGGGLTDIEKIKYQYLMTYHLGN